MTRRNSRPPVTDDWFLACGVPGCRRRAAYLVKYDGQIRNGALAICLEDAWHLATWNAHRNPGLVVLVRPLF